MENENQKVDLAAYATSSVVLYEVVSIDEFCNIVHHWHPDLPLDVKEVKKSLSQFTDENKNALFCVKEDYVCHYMLGMTEEGIRSLLADFFARRRGRIRWMPETEDEFLAYNADEVHIESPAGKALESFLSTHGLEDEDFRLEMLLPIMYDHQYGVSIEESLSNLTENIDFKIMEDSDDTNRFRELMRDFLDTMRLSVNYGWTPRELNQCTKIPMPDYLLPLDLDENRPIESPEPKIGRNDPCPCGSGKKYKKCCGRNQPTTPANDERLSVYHAWHQRTNDFIRRYLSPLGTRNLYEAAGERLGFLKDGMSYDTLHNKAKRLSAIDYAVMMDDQFGPSPLQQLREKPEQFKGERLETFRFISQYRYTWLKILGAVEGVGCSCRDLLTGEEGFLMNPEFSKSLSVHGKVCCGGICTLPNGTWMFICNWISLRFDDSELALKTILTQLSLPYIAPIKLSPADQARFAAETIRRVTVDGYFDQFNRP